MKKPESHVPAGEINIEDTRQSDLLFKQSYKTKRWHSFDKNFLSTSSVQGSMQAGGTAVKKRSSHANREDTY